MSKVKRYVFVNGYGLVRFKSTESIMYSDGSIQLYGKIKRKGLRSGNGKKWIDHDYWYTADQIFNSREEAIEDLWNKTVGDMEVEVRPEKLDPKYYTFTTTDFGGANDGGMWTSTNTRGGFDEVKSDIISGDSGRIIGKTLHQAQELLKREGFVNRVSVIDGVGQIGTCDINPFRVNLEVEGGYVTDYSMG